MKGIILAAGRGSRMKELTDDRPKCLVEVNGRSLLDRQIDAMRRAGLQEIGIVTGYRRELLAGRADREFHNPRWDETNMVSSLECASEWLVSGSCIVSYSDIFYEPEAVSLLMQSQAALAVSFDPDWLELWTRRFGDPLLDAETFRLDDSRRLVEIGNKPSTVAQVQGQYMGLLRFTPDGWAELESVRSKLTAAERDRAHMTGTLQRIIDAGRVPVEALAYRAPWGEVDTSEDLATYHRASSPAA